jgi:hypothetical protein
MENSYSSPITIILPRFVIKLAMLRASPFPLTTQDPIQQPVFPHVSAVVPFRIVRLEMLHVAPNRAQLDLVSRHGEVTTG